MLENFAKMCISTTALGIEEEYTGVLDATQQNFVCSFNIGRCDPSLSHLSTLSVYFIHFFYCAALEYIHIGDYAYGFILHSED